MLAVANMIVKHFFIFLLTNENDCDKIIREVSND